MQKSTSNTQQPDTGSDKQPSVEKQMTNSADKKQTSPEQQSSSKTEQQKDKPESTTEAPAEQYDLLQAHFVTMHKFKRHKRAI